MEALQPPRGTRDLFGEEQRRHAHVIETARGVAARYGFDEWSTPIFEDTRVFARTLGETSDVVTKEMYSFPDRGGDSLTLRPEGTAAICRALVSNGLTQSLPQKIYYAGPMFRYERPQKGRYRQFHQIGAELIGPSEPLADAETIALARDILAALGLADMVVLELNTLGDGESRAAWREALVSYLHEVRGGLSPESLARLARNPLRILDSKSPADQALLADAPVIAGFLTDASRRFWDDLRRRLEDFAVAFRENPRIVRGLDYYSHTAFEFTTRSLGAQGAVIAGGRYDGLVAEMGGPQTPAIGWAGGVERLAMLLGEAPAGPRSIAIVPIGEPVQRAAIGVMQGLRAAGIRAEMAYRGNAKRQLERANRSGAAFAVILGEEELARAVVQVKDLASGQQDEIALDRLPDMLHRRIAGLGR